MLKTVEGIFREGQIELMEMPDGLRSPTPVMVTFLETRPIDLRAYGITRAEAADLRDRLASFAEDWESPEMTSMTTTRRPSVKRGDVVLVLFPHSDLTSDHHGRDLTPRDHAFDLLLGLLDLDRPRRRRL